MSGKRLALLWSWLLTATLASAQDTEMVPFSQIIRDGGWTMWVLVFLSVCVGFLVILFLLTLRMGMLMPARFLREAEQVAQQGDAEALATVCDQDGSPGARIIGAAAQMLHTMPATPYSVLRDVIEDEGGRQSNALWQRIQYLMDIATVAPMVGLLGTVLGMIEAFVGLREDFGAVKPIGLATGVSKALVTTAGGLIVGIIAMILFSYFRGRVSRLVSRLEEECSAILQRLLVSCGAGRAAAEGQSRSEANR